MTRKLLYALLPLLTVMMFTACISDDNLSGCDTTTGKEVQLTFTIVSSNGSNHATRAEETWKDYEDGEHGTLYETQIDPGNLQVFVYDTDNNYVGTVNLTSYSPVREGTDENTRWKYTFNGTLAVSEGSGVLTNSHLNAKLVLLANCPTFTPSANSTLADMAELAFNYSNGKGYGADGNAPSTLIPMWGVLSVDQDLRVNWNTDLGDIWMLRSMAKITLGIEEDNNTELAISNPTLSKYNNSGYIVPKDYVDATTTESLTTETASFKPKADANTDVLSFYKEEDNSYVIYVPEYDGTKDDVELSFDYAIGGATSTQNYSFKLKDYTYNYDGETLGNGKIVRNHTYNYTVKAEDTKVIIQFTCLPWNLVETNIGWQVKDDELTGIKAMLYSGGVTTKATSLYLSDGTSVSVVNSPESFTDATDGDEEARYCYVSYPRFNDNHDKLDDQRAGATFYLLITAPKGAVWKANLTNTDLFEFEVRNVDTWKYKDENNKDVENYYSSTGIARADYYDESGKKYYCKPYQIQVKPRNRWFNVTRGSNNKAEGLSFDNVTGNTDYGTEWEKKYWNENNGIYSGPYTDLYITISLDGEHDYVLPINEKNAKYYTKNGAEEAVKTFYKDSDSNSNTFRFAGNPDDPEHYIRIWQLKARKGLTHEEMSTANKSGTNSEGKTFVGNDTFSKK